MGDLHEDRDIISPLYSVTLLANHPASRLGRLLAPVDSNDTALAWVTTFDRSHPYSLSCIARRGDEDRDRRAESQRAPDMDWCGRFCELPRPPVALAPDFG